jgi:ribonuclease P protein component
MVVVPQGVSGYAVVIPKKVLRLSAARHRLKRQIMEVMREHALPPAMIVFPRAVSGSVHYEDIQTELGKLIASIHT